MTPLPKSTELVVWSAAITDPDASVFIESASDGDYQVSFVDNVSQMFYNFLPLETSLHAAKLRCLKLLEGAIVDAQEQLDEAAGT